MNLMTLSKEHSSGMTSIPRLIMLIGYQRRKPFGFSDQFLAYQCQANRFVTVIKYVADPAMRKEDCLNCDYMISEINQAYLRCTLTGNLKKTVNEILKTYQSDFIILENAGRADLSSLIKEVSSLEELIRFDSVTTVIDSFVAEKTIETSQEAQQQINVADIILLDKKELLDEIRMQNLIRILREYNPRAPIISVKSRAFDPTLVYGINLLNYNQPELNEKEGYFKYSDEENDICDHLQVVRCRIHHPLNKKQFFKTIEEIPEKIFRIEGLVKFMDERFPVHLQYVCGRVDICHYPNPMFKDQFIMFVGRDMKDFKIQF